MVRESGSDVKVAPKHGAVERPPFRCAQNHVLRQTEKDGLELLQRWDPDLSTWEKAAA
jgi:hypothetical protein